MSAHVTHAVAWQWDSTSPVKVLWRCSCGGGGTDHPGLKVVCPYCRETVTIPDPPVTVKAAPTADIDELHAEIARLRAGEADTPAEEGVTPTAAQWIRMWNDGTAEQRHRWAQVIHDNAERASRCFHLDHEGRLADVDALIAALLHPALYLSGDEHGGVGLHCGDHYDGGRPLAYYGEPYNNPDVPTVKTIPGLWAEAVKHLAGEHVAPA